MCGCSIVQHLFVFYQQNNKRPKQVPSLDFEMYQFFFSPKYFFLFRSLSSAGCISVRESLSFQNNYFGEEAKIIIKTPPTQKKNDLVKCKVFPSNKSGLVKCNVFWHTKKFLFFFPRWLCLNDWIGEEKMFCLVDKIPAFEDCPFFAKVAFSVEKKRIEGKSCFCVLCNRAI